MKTFSKPRAAAVTFATGRAARFFGTLTLATATAGTTFAAGNADKGERIYRACVSCHSLNLGEHRTGPSLNGMWKRKAGTAAGFTRYSPALKGAKVTWDENNLDSWLKNPGRFIPGNRMTFPGIKDAATRSDLIAYLKLAMTKGAAAAPPKKGRRSGGMMGQSEITDLKSLPPAHKVTAMRHCRDSYYISTADGQTHVYWEFNLRLKTDSSRRGPVKGTAAIVGSGMRGDRASVIFSSPAEISAFIEETC